MTFMSDQAALSKRWRNHARWMAVKVNAARILEELGPWLAALGAAGFAVILMLRIRGDGPPPRLVLAWLLAPAFLMAVLAMLRVRRRLVGISASMVRLEARHRLHNALTMAGLGLAPWPEIPKVVLHGLAWRWARAAGPLAMCLLCLGAAFLLPVSQEPVVPRPEMQPQSWGQIQEWLKKLKEESIVSPQALIEPFSKLDELRDQPEDRWFSHESLHASDTLKEQLRNKIGALGGRMADAERSLGALQEHGDAMSEEGREQLLKEFSESMEAMKSGALPLHPDLIQELSQIDPKNLKGMSQEQLKQLRESLKNKSAACEGLDGDFGREKGFVGDGEGGDCAGRGARDRMATGPDGEGAGEGGVSRGPGVAPLTLSEDENAFGTSRNEGVQGRDYSRSQLGSVLDIQAGRHQVDKSAVTPAAAGEVKSEGRGGEQVWRETLTPEEKAVLRRVFE
jgi:hypothetical protein